MKSQHFTGKIFKILNSFREIYENSPLTRYMVLVRKL